MTTFSSYNNTLPDPNNNFGTGGGNAAGYNVAGPGYASVKLASEHKIMNTRTNSGRLISRDMSGHKWNISISYNPMTRDEFEPVHSFIAQQKGSMTPFMVSLPQYVAPRDPDFATFVASNTMTADPALPQGVAGSTTLLIQHSNYNSGTGGDGSAKPGDIFTLTDSGDLNHKKAYQVTRVETREIYLVNTTQLAATQQLITFSPPLQRTLVNTSNIVFHNPKFRVILAQNIIEYNLNTNNLYSFSLKLEEAQK